MKRAHIIRVGLLLVSVWVAAGAGTTFGRTSKSADQSLAAGRAALQQKHHAEAIQLLQNGLRRYPDDQRLRVELGRAYLYNHQDTYALALFRKVLRKDPSNRPAKLELARALSYRREYDASNQLYRQLLKVNPDDEAASVGLARNLIHQKHAAEGLRELDRALARHPNSVRLQQAKARMEKRLSKPSAKRAAVAPE
jgi:tetratricopeptide (TPR) repeat protein